MANNQTINALAERILQSYGVSYARILPQQKGYRNQSFPVEVQDGSKVNLILYKSEPGISRKIKAAHSVSNFLAGKNLPVRRAIDSRIICLRWDGHIKYGGLYSYLDGQTIPWEAYTKDHIKQLGRTMSDMHANLKSLDGSELSDVTEEYLAINSRMSRYFGDQGVQQALAAKLGLRVSAATCAHLEKLLEHCKQLPSKQALHMDFVRSNVLFKNEPTGDLRVRISGILDFEKTALGHPVLDAARTLAFLLVDCKYKPTHKVKKYFVDSGYNKRGAAHLPRSYLALLEDLCDLFLFYDFYKFLRHNPYEYLPQNEHFMRTKTLLLKRHLINRYTVK